MTYSPPLQLQQYRTRALSPLRLALLALSIGLLAVAFDAPLAQATVEQTVVSQSPVEAPGSAGNATATAQLQTKGNHDAPSKVKWRTFDQSLFAEAKKDNKFILLDLEAVWCHWCHVMDEETYRDDEVVALLNEHFICVKVDQDSRPDLSNKYEDYGWPATIFFDGEGQEIVKRSGYLSPERMKRLLTAIVRDPSPEKSSVAQLPTASAAVGSKVNTTADSSIGSSADKKKAAKSLLPAALYDDLLARHVKGFDTKNGAWGFEQKFLDWDSVEFALESGADGDKSAMERARKTLNGQLNLIDPAFGGVYQYSTDGDWRHPHFEKIMQMQAENLRIYALGYLLFRDVKYLNAARLIEGFLAEFLTSPEGAFYTSQDADLVQGEHSGDYFKLSRPDRLKAGLPRIDKHIYARENGWAINALTSLYAVTGEDKYLDRARKATAWIEAHRSLPGGGFSHDQPGEQGRIREQGRSREQGENAASHVESALQQGGGEPGPYLGDTLAMGRAYLGLYGVTGDRQWLKKAQGAADFIAKHFQVSGEPGFITAENKVGQVIKSAPLLDENVMMARFANLLFNYTGNAAYKDLAGSALTYLAKPEVAAKRRILVAGILLADREMAQAPPHITIVGAKSDAQAKQIFLAALKLPVPFKRVEWWDAREGAMPNNDTELPEMPKAAAFSCAEGRCSSPVYDGESLLKNFEKSRQIVR